MNFENGKQLKEELRIMLNVFGSDVKQEIKLFETRKKIDWAWFYEDGKAILIEDKEKNDVSFEEAMKQMDDYEKIVRNNGYFDIIRIVVKQEKNGLIINSKHNDIVIDSSQIFTLSHYKKILGFLKEEKINPKDVYYITNYINDLLHFKFKILHLIERMIFTGCLLIEAIHGNLNVKNIDTLSQLKIQVEETLKSLNNNKKNKSEKLNHLITKFKSVIFADPPKQDIKTLVNYILRLKDIVSHWENIESIDIMNVFFNEFGRMSGKNEHGQVFTPDHISQLMASLLQLKDTDRILDPTCGSGSLLIKAMFKSSKKLNQSQKNVFFEKNIYGIEMDPNILALSYINMLLHQDGITNIIEGNAIEISDWIKENKINKCISNPPYENQSKPIEIMKNVMDNMVCSNKEEKSLAVFLLPTSKLRVKSKDVYSKLLKKHSLKLIIKLPSIFDGIAAAGEVALFLFEIGIPQDFSKSIRGFWIKKDGYKTGKEYKNQGRVDDELIWEKIHKKILEKIENFKIEDYEFNFYPKLINLTEELEYSFFETLNFSQNDFKKTIVQRIIYENPKLSFFLNINNKEK